MLLGNGMLAFVLSSILTVPAVSLQSEIARLGYSILLLALSLGARGEVRTALIIAGSLGLFLTLFGGERPEGIYSVGPFKVLRVNGKEYVIGFNALGLLAILPLFALV